jgi:hypothetical protein
MFDIEVQDIGVGDKVHTDGVTEGGVPGDTLTATVFRMTEGSPK